ncbi:hypothetical protein ER308_16070 [Egibacter rhizosphaerae]|uniref:Uncharacterized protein n=1 Tax=Egibacter rhizosphaerae TaxID=1670831 RepID=A0A411YII4_9ACTN|nr:hypothetical protein [Egibacter rhizosphaerae]QBI20939.1 hypothetical protein ER308_16070 [Egibacter rhizosphaerae]
MASEAPLPSREEMRSQWARLDRDGRRRVRRAANRGREVESGDPREALVAAALAANQRRFWRWGWAIGPVVVALATIPQGLEAVLVNVLFVTLVVILLAVFFARRSARAEAANRQLAARRSKKKRNRRKGKGG